MPQSRKSQISLADTPYYHCISRCVRRAFLCGEDKLTGRSYAHRRKWVEDKLLSLPNIFAIDVCAYAVMHNHTHVVLHIDEQQTEGWSTKEILTRWHRLFKGTLLGSRFLKGIELSSIELQTIEDMAKVYKSRLCDISWFMRVLNEGIARQANKEDECTGRFWEGRFKSQALLDEAALIACMAYVDLNPIRAGVAQTPEQSDHTSIRQRVRYALDNKQPSSLLPFVGNTQGPRRKGLNFHLKGYLELVDETGRCMRDGKIGFITSELPDILTRLNISEASWLIMSKRFTRVFHGAVGSIETLIQYHETHQHKRRSNYQSCIRLFG